MADFGPVADRQLSARQSAKSRLSGYDPIEAAVQNVLTAANVGADVALTTCLKFAQESVS